MFEARDITKTYGPTRANDRLSLSIGPGEILGLLGENGAGKSTLLAILAGQRQPDAGTLAIDGVPVRFQAPGNAMDAGIGIVFQHFSLVPTFTIREQLRLAGWKEAGLPRLLADRFTGNEVIGSLSLGEQQRVEIARALARRPRILLLDEPTSILTSSEVDQLFVLLRDVREAGTAIVLVTHKLHEAMSLCDRIVVLRAGTNVDEVARDGVSWPPGTESRLVRSMFGERQTAAAGPAVAPAYGGTPALEVAGLSTDAGAGRMGLRNVTFTVGRGEICAIAGIDGQGQREIAEACAGYRAARGQIWIHGTAMQPGDAVAFSDAGVAWLTDDRIGEGSIPTFTVEDTLLMKRQRSAPFSRGGFLNVAAIRESARTAIDRWGVRPPNAGAPIGTLSGGNIQKVLIARETAIATSLLVVSQPSHGLDVHTRHLVWGALRTFAADGGGVLVLTTDLDEALGLADRAGVVAGGRVSGLRPVTEVSHAEMERLMVTAWA